MMFCLFKKEFFLFCLLLLPAYALSQSELSYRLEAFGSATDGEYTPFWMTSNTYGVVPLETNNAYIRGKVFWNQHFNKDFKVNAGVDLITAAHHTSSFYIQQLFAEASYRSLLLSIGLKERYNSMLDKNLSVGDLNYSTNARPIPELNISIPEFVKVPYTKEILQIKGDFAIGKSTDNDYIIRTKNADDIYSKDILWHHKSVFFRIEDPEKKFPFSATIGIDHGVQWGGWTSFTDFGEMPKSFKDFIKVVLGKEGGENAMEGEQINVLGNHQGTYNLKVGYQNKDFYAAVYKQHYFDDKSGTAYTNWRDGIWGVEAMFNTQPYVKKLVCEFLNTTDQSGPMHFISYETDRYSPRGGGDDDYYNNVFYVTGWSHWGRGLGNPLLTSPEYNKNGDFHFMNNRVKALHLGMEGDIIQEISYRALFTGMQAWGRMSYPFLKKKRNFSSLLEFNYNPQKLGGWLFSLQLALDQGSLYEDNIGCSIKISKTGIIGLRK